MKKIYLFTLLSIVFALSGCSDTNSETSEDGFYSSGDNINLVVPFSPGGGTDVTSRLLTEYWSEYSEGNPTFQVENIEGGGSVNGANEYAHLRDADGYNILATSASTKIPFLIGESHVEFDLNNFEPIVGFPTGVVVYSSPESGVEEPIDLSTTDENLVMGATSPTSIDVMTLLALEVLELRDTVQVNFGYEGAGASRVAFEQGETNMDYQSVPAYLQNVTPIVEEGNAIPLFTLGFLDSEANLIRDPALPDLPTVEEVHVEIHGQEPSGEAWEAYKDFVGVVNNLHRGYWIHEEAPDEAVVSLRESAAQAVTDEEFLEFAEEDLGGYGALVGEDLENALSNLQQIDQSSIDFVQNFLETEYDVRNLGE